MTTTSTKFEEKEAIVVRFAGDSGDGMQTVGEQFTDSSAFAGNDLATLPDFFPLKFEPLPEHCLVYLVFNFNLGAAKFTHRETHQMLCCYEPSGFES